MPTVMISGGFDPIHEGHIAYIEGAAKLGDVLIALNSDEWLIRKKGFCFLPFSTRALILRAMKNVTSVLRIDDSDGTVCKALEEYKPDIFAKGGDRALHNTPEVSLCEKLGIELAWNIGGGKIASSSNIVAEANRNTLVKRMWGHYRVLYSGSGIKVKELMLEPHLSTSLQKHKHRTEFWFTHNGLKSYYQPGEWHQLSNNTDQSMTIIEVQTGEYLGEDDIERIQ